MDEKFNTEDAVSPETLGETTLENSSNNQILKRNITLLETVGAGWNICNSWASVAATFAIGFVQCGPASIIYGIIVVFVAVGSSAATLAELASVYPTAGGQYHWTAILAPKKVSRGLSYVCGCLNTFQWVAGCAGITIIPAQILLGVIIQLDPTYVPKLWHYFLIYQAVNVLILLNNIFLQKRMPWIHNVGLGLSLVSFVTITVTAVARSGTRQPSAFVWTTFISGSGWSSTGVDFLIGLVTANYMYAGIDGAIHLAEECRNPRVAVPVALMTTAVVGFVASFCFAIAMLYNIANFDAVLTTKTGVQIYELWMEAARSEAAGTIFVILLLVAAIFSLNGSQQTASRLTWSFARDDALIFSKHIGKLDKTLDVPVWALLFNAAIIFLIGCIYLASTTAFNALVSISLILQQLTFALPAGLLLFRRRSHKYLPAGRPFKLGAFGWVANSITVAFAVIITVFYDLPVVLPVSASTMNYASVVLGIIVVFSTLNWFWHARRRYHGPVLESQMILDSYTAQVQEFS